MQTVTAFVSRDPVSCWRAFIDASQLPAWVPGLRSAQILSKARGLPAEVHFEYAGSLAYTLVYTYDVAQREVRWEPKLGPRDGVRGVARFEPSGEGTLMTYGLELGDGRSPEDRTLGDQQALIAAFVAWLGGERPRP